MDIVLEGYNDANWITLGGTLVSWKSSKQIGIARYIMESEFIALDKCEGDVEWLRHFLEDIPR